MRFLAASISLVALTTAQSLPLGDYLAQQTGTWTYTTAGGASPVVNATTTNRTRVTSFGGGIHLTTSLALTNDGLILLGEDSNIPGNSYNETEDPVTVILPPTLVVNGPVTGDNGTYFGTSPEGPYSGTHIVTTEVENFENFTVPAGTFSALKIIVTVAWDEGAESGSTINTFWLAKGRGVVRFRYQDLEGFDETFDLISSPAQPTAPTGGSSTSQTGSVQLSWPKVAGADFYRVYRSNSPVFASATLLGTVAQPGGSTANFTDATTVGTTSYHYFLESVVGTAPSEPSAAITGSALPEMSFSTTLMDSGLSGLDALPEADPNEDGIQNGVAYSLEIPLVGPVTDEERSRLPQSMAPSINNRPVYKVILPDDAPDDVIYVIETTTDLFTGLWTEIATKAGDAAWSGTATVSMGSPVSGFVCVEIEGTQTIASAPLGFMRLRVEIVE